MDCVKQCVMDVQLFLFVCLFDGCMDALQKEAGGGAGEGAPPAAQTRVMWFGCLVCWLLGWLDGLLVWPLRCLAGWSVGWHSAMVA